MISSCYRSGFRISLVLILSGVVHFLSYAHQAEGYVTELIRPNNDHRSNRIIDLSSCSDSTSENRNDDSDIEVRLTDENHLHKHNHTHFHFKLDVNDENSHHRHQEQHRPHHHGSSTAGHLVDTVVRDVLGDNRDETHKTRHRDDNDKNAFDDDDGGRESRLKHVHSHRDEVFSKYGKSSQLSDSPYDESDLDDSSDEFLNRRIDEIMKKQLHQLQYDSSDEESSSCSSSTSELEDKLHSLNQLPRVLHVAPYDC